MSFLSTIKRVFNSSAAKTVITVVGTALTRAAAAAALAGNPIGDTAIAAAAAADNTNLSGPDKKAQVVNAITPIITTLAAKGGFASLAVDAEQFAGLVVEEVVAAMKPTPLVSIAAAIMAALNL